jgi:hypothetical protein
MLTKNWRHRIVEKNDARRIHSNLLHDHIYGEKQTIPSDNQPWQWKLLYDTYDVRIKTSV